MLNTYMKLKAPVFGRGKAKLTFTKAFDKLEPENQMLVLSQAMIALREAHKRAERNHRIRRQHEDARNAEAIRPAVSAS